MRRCERFLWASVCLLVLSLAFCWAEGGITLSESEFQTLRTALIQADEQLQKSEQTIGTLKTRLDESLTECGRLTDLLKTQDGQLETLEQQLRTASESLRKLKSEATLNHVKMIVIGVLGVALGGASVYLMMGGR